MLPFIGTTNPIISTNNISGYWESNYGKVSFIIEADRRGLRVKNSRYGGWTYYDRARGRSNAYVNGRYKTIYVRSYGQLVFEDRRARLKYTLTKKRLRSNYGGGYNNNRGYNGKGGNYGYNNRSYGNNRTYNDGYNNSSRKGLSNYDPRSIRKAIDDNWYNRQYDVKIKIKDTDTGIKMRRTGLNRYTYFLQDYRNPTIFSDDRGNTIEIVSEYEIVWFDGRNNRTLYFARD